MITAKVTKIGAWHLLCTLVSMPTTSDSACHTLLLLLLQLNLQDSYHTAASSSAVTEENQLLTQHNWQQQHPASFVALATSTRKRKDDKGGDEKARHGRMLQLELQPRRPLGGHREPMPPDRLVRKPQGGPMLIINAFAWGVWRRILAPRQQ